MVFLGVASDGGLTVDTAPPPEAENLCWVIFRECACALGESVLSCLGCRKKRHGRAKTLGLHLSRGLFGGAKADQGKKTC